MAVAYIEGWITLKDDVSYINLVLGVIREISTYIRNEIPKITQYREQYYWRKKHEIFKHTRFDVMEDAIKKESNKNIHNQKYNETMREYNRDLAQKAIAQAGSIKMDSGAPVM